jgi:membrane protein implicated in regulation of membrane protease activity
MKVIFKHRWNKIIALVSFGVIIAAGVLYAMAHFFEVGTFEFILVAVAFMFIGDFIVAWNNERAIEQGKVELHNCILGKEATVIAPFLPVDNGYKGKVSLSGERWAANSSVELIEGDTVRVLGREGLVLLVERHE